MLILQLLYLTVSKFWYSSYIVITLHNIKILLSLLLLSHSTISKFYQTANWDFFELVGRNYVSVKSIIIISNVTVSVPHNVIWIFYAYEPWCQYMRRLLQLSAPTPPTYQVFTRFACCFTRTNLSTFFSSYQIIAKCKNGFFHRNSTSDISTNIHNHVWYKNCFNMKCFLKKLNRGIPRRIQDSVKYLK